MLRSPGYAKEVQSLRYFKEKATQQQQQQQQQQPQPPLSGAGSATVLQSAFNLANILMGVGLLGLPFGFKVAGYAGGLVCTLIFGVITWQTSILIGRELNGDPRPSHTFCDNPFKKSSCTRDGSRSTLSAHSRISRYCPTILWTVGLSGTQHFAIL